MTDAKLLTKCRQLLHRREARVSAWFYVTHGWRCLLFFDIAYIVIAVALWSISWPFTALAFLSFFFGCVVRDIQWWRALAKEWPTTAELIDWPHVEAIASGTPQEASPVT